MRWICFLLVCVNIHATENHFSISQDEVQQLRRCRSDSEIWRKRRHSLRRPPDRHHHHYHHTQTPTAPYAQDHNLHWLHCTPAQATVKAAYIGCFATITAGLGATLIGVLATGS